MEDEDEEDYKCPIWRAPMVIPISLPNGQVYDLVSLLQMYKSARGDLKGTMTLTDPLTRDQFYMEPEKIRPSKILMAAFRKKNFDEYVGLPKDIEIIKFIFSKSFSLFHSSKNLFFENTCNSESEINIG